MVFISHLLERFSNSSKASLARTADWINSQAVSGNFSEPSGSPCNDDDARGNPTSRVQQTGQSAGSNLRIDHLLNSTYRSANVTPVVGANEEEGMCFVMGCQICETQTPAEQILARNQNLCGLRIVLRSAEDEGEGAWSSVASDDTGDGRRGLLKRKAKRITRFCGHLYESVEWDRQGSILNDMPNPIPNERKDCLKGGSQPAYHVVAAAFQLDDSNVSKLAQA